MMTKGLTNDSEAILFSPNMSIFWCILVPLHKVLSSKYRDTLYKAAYMEMVWFLIQGTIISMVNELDKVISKLFLGVTTSTVYRIEWLSKNSKSERFIPSEEKPECNYPLKLKQLFLRICFDLCLTTLIDKMNSYWSECTQLYMYDSYMMQL